jgi:hypothetical protein
MSPTKKKAAARRAPKRQTPGVSRRLSPKKKNMAGRARSRATAPPLHEASPAHQARLFRALARVMTQHGVNDEIAAVHLTARAAAVPGGCPPGQVARIVCVKQPDGTVACRSECQPI